MDASKSFVDVRTGYDRWSEVYDSDGNPLVALEDLHFPALVGSVEAPGRA
jgi:hypothetical protein